MIASRAVFSLRSSQSCLFACLPTSVTMECGIPTSVLGDCVIARNFDDENNFRRVDFTLEEYFKDKEWRLSAQKANTERGSTTNQTKQLQELLAKSQQSGQIVNMIDAATSRQAAQAAAAAAAVPAVKTCSNPACERDAHMRCGRCKRSSYCSVECQKQSGTHSNAQVHTYAKCSERVPSLSLDSHRVDSAVCCSPLPRVQRLQVPQEECVHSKRCSSSSGCGNNERDDGNTSSGSDSSSRDNNRGSGNSDDHTAINCTGTRAHAANLKQIGSHYCTEQTRHVLFQQY